MSNEVLRAYGTWIAGLAPWEEFVTLTHRERTSWGTFTRVGVSQHRRLVKAWFYGDGPFRGMGVRDVDPAARWWSETEFHQSGIPHEHGLLATGVDGTDRRTMRDVWRSVCGELSKAQGARFDRIKDEVGACAYVAKYTQKSASKEPRVFGFGTEDDLQLIGRELRDHPDSRWSRAVLSEGAAAEELPRFAFGRTVL